MGSYRPLAVLAVGLLLLLLFSLACAAKETPTRAPGAPAAAPTATKAPAPAAATPAAREKPQYGGTLRFAIPIGTIRSLDPHYSTDWSEYPVNFLVQNNLVKITAPDGVIGPDLAQSWNFSPDGKVITFNLVKNAKYHDGTEFDAEAAKWNLQRVMDPNVGANQAAQLEPIERVEVVDKYILKVYLKRPWRPILASLAERPGYMPSPVAVQKTNSYANRQGDFGKNPVGTGAYKFREWLPSNRIVLEKFDGYFELKAGGPPYLDSIAFNHFSEESMGIAMIRAGEADILEMEGPMLAQLPLIKQTADLKLIGGPTGRTYFIQFTVDKAPYDKQALRQAVAYAIDRKAIINALFFGEGALAYQSEGKGWAFDPKARYFDYDPKKAKDKLAEAGYPIGITLKYWCTTSTADIQLCEAIKAQLSTVGIKLDIQQILSADLWKKIYEKPDHGIDFWNTWWSPRGDPHGRLQILINSQGFHAKTAHYNNPEVDRLMAEAAGIYDVAKAQPIYWKIQEIATLDAAYVWMLHPNNYMAAHKKVRGFDWAPDVIIRLRDVWLAK